MLSHDHFDEMIRDWMSYAPLCMSIHVWQFRSICCISMTIFFFDPPKSIACSGYVQFTPCVRLRVLRLVLLQSDFTELIK